MKLEKFKNTMVLILDGNSDVGAHVRIDLGVLVSLRHLFRSRAVTNLTFSSVFLHDQILILFSRSKSGSESTPPGSVTPFRHTVDKKSYRSKILPFFGKVILCIVLNSLLSMVLISDGNSETGAHVRIILCYLIC